MLFCRSAEHVVGLGALHGGEEEVQAVGEDLAHMEETWGWRHGRMENTLGLPSISILSGNNNGNHDVHCILSRERSIPLGGSFFLENLRKPWGNGQLLERTMVEKKR